MPVDLTRDLAPARTNIPTTPGNAYRAAGEAGFRDFRSTGLIRGNPAGPYKSTYYSFDAPLERYAGSARQARSHIVESLPNEKLQNVSAPGQNSRGITEPGNELTKNDRIRWWAETKPGQYKSVYDNITPYKYYGRQALRALPAVAGPIGGLMALADTPEIASGTLSRQERANPRAYMMEGFR